MLERLFDDGRVIVCLGPGGVGKTTTAAALAVAGARRGRRVAVLTVDPAARLRDALELPERPGEFHRVPLSSETPGTLDAILLDAKGLFDELVRRLSPNGTLTDRILENPVYRNVAGAFAGSDAYMALEQLLDVVGNPSFDLIVVDTPPASHALELFDAPERILALLNSRALEYLSEPVRILGIATSRLAKGLLSAVLAALERMTGLSLLRDVSDLAADFGAVSPAFRQRAESIRRLLRDEQTRYVLMTSPDPHGERDTVEFAAEVASFGIDLDAVVVNRVLRLDAPARGPRPAEAEASAKDDTAERAAWPAALARNLVTCARDLQAIRSAQRETIESLRSGLESIRSGQAARASLDPLWLELPALSPAPTTLAGIEELARGFGDGRDTAHRAASHTRTT